MISEDKNARRATSLVRTGPSVMFNDYPYATDQKQPEERTAHSDDENNDEKNDKKNDDATIVAL
jgi:hypothetical protein